MTGSVKCVFFLLAGLIFAKALPATGQIKLGDTSTNLNGTVSVGYSGDYGNAVGSDHNWNVGGAANASGFFYSPKFLSYSANIYLNQSRANSNFQSISNASGIALTTNLFAGSHFPGAISYSKAINSEGNYAVPGLANYVTRGNSDAVGINWSANLPKMPTVSVGFQKGSGKYSVYGTDDDGNTSYDSLNLNSGYTVAGLSMAGFYNKGGSHSLLPGVVTGEATAETQSDTDSYGFNVSHRLPFNGSFAATVNRSSWNTGFQGTSSTGSIDLVSLTAGAHPTNKFFLSTSASYSDNLSGQLIEAILGAGGVPTGTDSNESSDSLDLFGSATYELAEKLQAYATIDRRAQSFEGQNYGVTSYGGGARYSHALFDGSLNTAVNLSLNTSDQSGEDDLGFTVDESYTGEIKRWGIQESAGYSQNVETLLITYMNSVYNFSSSANRRFGQYSLTLSAGGSRTALTQQPGAASQTQSYSGNFGYTSILTVGGSYSKSSGEALVTGAGLVPVDTIPPSSSLVSLYGGVGYGISLTSTPVKRLTLSANYAKSNSNTSSTGFASVNENDEYNALIIYQVRKLYLTGGFSRLGQGFSASGSPPEAVSSYYLGVSRWFNFF